MCKWCLEKMAEIVGQVAPPGELQKALDTFDSVYKKAYLQEMRMKVEAILLLTEVIDTVREWTVFLLASVCYGFFLNLEKLWNVFLVYNIVICNCCKVWSVYFCCIHILLLQLGLSRQDPEDRY